MLDQGSTRRRAEDGARWASHDIAGIAARLGCSERTVKRHRSRLARWGWLRYSDRFWRLDGELLEMVQRWTSDYDVEDSDRWLLVYSDTDLWGALGAGAEQLASADRRPSPHGVLTFVACTLLDIAEVCDRSHDEIGRLVGLGRAEITRALGELADGGLRVQGPQHYATAVADPEIVRRRRGNCPGPAAVPYCRARAQAAKRAASWGSAPAPAGHRSRRLGARDHAMAVLRRGRAAQLGRTRRQHLSDVAAQAEQSLYEAERRRRTQRLNGQRE